MTAVAGEGGGRGEGAFSVRAAVPDVWDHVALSVDEGTTVADVKRRGLEQALGRVVPPESFIVKYHGAQVLDEGLTLKALGVQPNAPLIILPARRRPVR